MKIFLGHWNSVLYDVQNELIRQGHQVTTDSSFLENPRDLDVGVFWNETFMGNNKKHWGDFVNDFNKKGIKTVLCQHGRFGTSRIFPPFNEKLQCQKACLWGNADKARYMSVGTSQDRLFVTGTTLFKNLKPRVKQKKPTVVFCPEHWGDEVEENLAIALELRKIKGINIVTKLLEGNHYVDWYDNPVITERNSPEHLKMVAEVLSKADVVVGLFASTFELLAQHLDIPVIIVDIWRPKSCSGDDRYKEYKRNIANGTNIVKLHELKDAIKYAIKHPEFMRDERKKAVIEDGGSDIKDPVQEIVKVITSYL